jgi:polysaccharide deacetylase 2 family uncharacterized protein YibQ
VGLLAILVFLAVAVTAACVLINRQIKGYFAVPSKRTAPQVGISPPATPTSLLVPSPAATVEVSGTGPRVAIIIDDCGYTVKRCKPFLEMPIPLTISILPMTPHGKELEADALAAGKNVLLHLPMEPESAAKHPGPGEILTQMTDSQIQDQVEADLNSVPDVPGANNHMGSKATSDPRVMRDVLEVFQRRHLFFIDSMTAYTTVAATTAHDLGVPTARRDVFLDDSHSLPYIEGQFAQLERVALKQGTAIAIGHPFAQTAQALMHEIPILEAAGITFVPAQTLVR